MKGEGGFTCGEGAGGVGRESRRLEAREHRRRRWISRFGSEVRRPGEISGGERERVGWGRAAAVEGGGDGGGVA